MTWLIGWNRRKSKIINGSTAGLQTDYQLKLTIHKGIGTDTTTDIYLGTNIRDDFGDVRFTGSDQTTLLSYWIEYYISGSYAIVWVQVDSIPISPGTSTIYLYYDNPSSTTTSSLANTFLAADLTTFTKVDPNSRVTINNANKATFLDLHRNENVYLYKSISPTQDYRYDFEYMLTGGGSTANHDGYFFIGGMNEIANNPIISNNYLSIRNYAAFHISTYRSYMQRSINGSVSIVPPGDNYAPISLNTLYYATVTRIGTTVTMNIYTNSSRTIHIGGSPRSGTVSPAVVMNYAIPLASWYDGDAIGYVSGYIQNPTLRKYTSPEPTFGTTGIEELPGTPLCPSGLKYEGDIVHLSATPRDGTGSYYVEFRKNITSIASYSNAPENVEVTYDYILTNEDIRTALTGIIDFSVYIEDSCPTGTKTCTNVCTINIGCLAPVCNFIVT